MPTIITSRSSALSSAIPSTHRIGDIVLFKPLALLPFTQWFALARVERISFDVGKVLYDLALQDDQGFYDTYPLCNVDSIFVGSTPPSP